MSHITSKHVHLALDRVVLAHFDKLGSESARIGRAVVEVAGPGIATPEIVEVTGRSGHGAFMNHRGRIDFHGTGDPNRNRFHIQLILIDRLGQSSYSGLEASGAITQDDQGELTLKLSRLVVLNNVWDWLDWR